MYFLFEEYRDLQKEKWNEKYVNQRAIFWDDTNVSLAYQPIGASKQRLTYLAYYGKNYTKGGVFLQLCGWLGVEELWVGATSDTHYQENTKIFERQDRFS